MGRSHFSFDGERKVCKRKHAARRLQRRPAPLRVAGFGLREYSTREAMKSCRLPLFLAHGEADTFVPCVMSRQTFDACTSENKVLFTVPGAAHGRSYLVDREGYEKTLLAFLKKILEQ